MMTSIGRGRGWSDAPIRKPGSVTSDNIIRDLIDKIVLYDTSPYDICVYYHDTSSHVLQAIINLLNSAVAKGNLKNTCETLWKQAILNESLIVNVAIIFSNKTIALIEDNDKSIIRKYFLHFLQDNYMSREKTRLEDRQIFTNIVSLHAEVYYRMLINDKRLKVFAKPLIDYLSDLLLISSTDNIKFIMIQMLRSGKDLHARHPDELKSLIMIVRRILITRYDYSPEVHSMLLLMIDLANNDYEIKDTQLKEFYLLSISFLSTVYPFSQKEKIDTKTENENQTQEIDNNEHAIEIGIKSDVHEQSNYMKGSTVPRAIRGTGATDKKEEDDLNTTLTSIEIAPARRKNKGWDHDDRFHKDYQLL